MDNLPLHLASLNKLKATVERYSRLIQDKGYSDLNTKRYKKTIKNLKDRIEGEINSIQSQVNLCIQQDTLLLGFQKELNQIYSDMWNESDSIKSEIIKEIEQATMNSGWLLPTSCFILISQEGKNTHSIKDDLDIIGDFIDNNSNNLLLDDLFLKQLLVPKKIQETLEYWKEVKNLKNRYHILEEGVQNHLDEKFYSSVSTLMPQVEGILRAAIEASGRQADFNKLEPCKIKRAFLSLKEEWKNKNKDPRSLILLNNLPTTVANLYQEYQQSTSGSLNVLSRHGVCHGLQTNFGTAANSLKLILILDRIIFFYDDNQSS